MRTHRRFAGQRAGHYHVTAAGAEVLKQRRRISELEALLEDQRQRVRQFEASVFAAVEDGSHEAAQRVNANLCLIQMLGEGEGCDA